MAGAESDKERPSRADKCEGCGVRRYELPVLSLYVMCYYFGFGLLAECLVKARVEE